MPIEMQQMLIKFKQRFEDIQNAKRDSYIRSVRMGALMTDMEVAFQMPMYGANRIAAFKRAFPGVIEFYREVSSARDL